MADDGRGNFGNTEEHQKAGSMSSGNQGNPQQHAEAGRKGGQAAHESGNAHEWNSEEASEAGRKVVVNNI